MQTRNGYSLLGFGCMRLPKDYEVSKALVLEAVRRGINYFDTAYLYQGNEALLGRILDEGGCRDKVRIASKVQPFQINKSEDFEKRFQTQLERLRTDRIDNYLMHMLPDTAVWDRLRSLGVEEWIAEKKRKGQIENIGFSFHGKTDTFIELINSYDWDFCQVQYNYMDVHTQAGIEGVRAAYEKGLDVIIMEPLRGGTLTEGLPQKARALFDRSGDTPASWGLRWLFGQPEVACVLSGMKTEEMLDENIKTAENFTSFSAEDEAIIEQVREAIRADNKIACTGCAYCMPCPYGVDIPASFQAYNESYNEGFIKGMSTYLSLTTLKAKRSNAELCTRCGLCETKCPQRLEIRDDLDLVKRRLENPIYRLIAWYTKRMYRS